MSNKAVEQSNGKVETEKPTKKGIKGKTSKELSAIHMHDKNHVITDEDIKNLALDFDAPIRDTSHTPDIENDSERPKDEDKDSGMITPWNLID